MINWVINRLMRWWYQRKLVKLIDKANKRKRLTGYKYMVIRWKHRLVLVRKQELKQMVLEKYFRKGVTIQKLEKNALYITI